MDKWLDEKNNILVDNSPGIPLNYGEIQAKKDMQKFKENLIHESNDDEKLKPEFIEEMKSIEKEKSFPLENLDDLFE